MRNLVLVAVLLCCSLVKAQHTYFGITGDFNTGIGQRFTYSTGLHLEMAVRGCDNLYFNWHYSLGTNSHSEAYAHGPVSLLLYRSHILANVNARINDWRILMLMLFGPPCCPTGMTYYFQGSQKIPTGNLRFGVYCDPFSLDVWKMDHTVKSWTIDAGTKCMLSTRSSLCFYFAAGFAYTNNLERNSHGYGDELLFQLQLGMINAGDFLYYRSRSDKKK